MIKSTIDLRCYFLAVLFGFSLMGSKYTIAVPDSYLETQVTAKIVEYRRDVYITRSGIPAQKYDVIRLRIIAPYSLQTKEFKLMAEPRDRKMFERVGGLIGFSIKTSKLHDLLKGRKSWEFWFSLKNVKELV